jgi:hypothetical protein
MLIKFGVALLGLFLGFNAQALGYSASITTGYPALAVNPSATQVVWASCNSTGPWPSAFRLCDDGVSQVVPIGFAFTFAGTTYSNWSMSTNGVIYFETGSTGDSTGNNTFTPANLPTTALGSPAKPALMPFWADLQKNASVAGANNVGQPANASFYQYELLNQPSGAKVLVVQLRNVVFFNAGSLTVNMQIQIWSTGEIVYSYGALQAVTTNPLLRIGLQSAGGTYCNTLASNQTSALSNQSFVFQWDLAAPACAGQTTVNHYEIRHDGAATLCAEPIEILACTSSTSPCPAANILRATSTPALNAPITAQLTVTGTGVTNVSQSPPSVNIQPLNPVQVINLTWAAASAGTATLAINASVTATNPLRCTDVAGTATRACTMTVANAACIAPPHHYEIQGPASGSVCTSSTFTIKAWADAAQTVAYTAGVTTGTLTASGNPASVPSLGAFTIAAGSSTVTVTPIGFPTAGTTTFSTTATPALAGATTCNFAGSTSCAFAVASCVADFNCVESTGSGASAADANASTGRLYTKRAGTPFSFDVVARSSTGSVVTTYASDANKSVKVELVDGSGGTACAARSALSPAASVTQNFAASDMGRKSFSFSMANAYRDVRCRVTDTSTSPAIPAACSSDNFSIRPGAIVITTSASATPPPAANAANGSPTVKAGIGFTLQASTSTGTNYAGNLTLDTSKLSAQSTSQASSVQTGGAVGVLTPATLAVNPVSQPTGNAVYSEVGYLYLAMGALTDTASPSFTSVDDGPNADCIAGSFSDTLVGGKYGCNIGNAAAFSLGRFVPNHFDTAIVQSTAPITCPPGLTCPANASGANGLLYSGQAFSVVVAAKNALGAGGTTTNYQGVFAKMNSLSGWSAPSIAGIANPGGGAMGNASLAASSFAAGAGTGQPTYGWGSAALAPVDFYVRSVDADAVSSLRTAGSIEAGLKVASGRIKLPNAYGSERLALPITATVQFFNGVLWLTSSTDSASAFNSNLTSASGHVVVNVVNGLGGGLTIVNPSLAAVAGGVRTFEIAAPLVSGYANITINTPTYLPRATSLATFGVFKSPLIYRRENY